MSQQPSGVRGGTPPDRSVFQRRGGLKKATPSNVVADITGRGVLVGADAATEQPQQREASGFVQLHAAPAVQPEPLHLAPEPEQEPAATQPAPVQPPAPAPVEQAPIQQPVSPPVQPAPAPAPVQVQPAVQAAAPPEQPAQQPAKKAKTADAKVGFYQPREEGDRMRAAFIATRHITKHRTLSDFICSVVEAEVQRLENEYNDGKPFESEPNGVPRGRPIG